MSTAAQLQNTTAKSQSVSKSSHAQLLLQRTCACGSAKSALTGECEECKKSRRPLQAKLRIGASNDPLEQEADRVADQVLGAPADAKVSAATPRIQRASAQATAATDNVPASVDRVLAGSGRPLEPALQQDMGQRFGYDFSRVRVHTGAAAEQSARDVNAHAYTVGRDIVFGPGQFAPGSPQGRRLLAHELTHVVQAASATLSRLSAAAPDAAALTRTLGTVPRSGLHFIPNNITDTVVGPPDMRGGLLDSGASRLNVIVAENQTPLTLATELLPLWLTATPFTPPGAAAPLPLDIISAMELAQALLVYNQTYFPVPAMTRWRAGLRVPLPVRIDELTHVGTLHPLNIRALASGFDPAWLPLLNLRAAATAAPPAAVVRADAATFLTATPDALGRGIALGARAVTNATAELPFIREVFVQLGAAGFDVALQFMGNLVNREVDLLAAQTDGAAILAVLRAALAAAPVAPTAAQQASLTRANLMLGRVAAAVAVAGPTAMQNRAEKTVSIDTVKLDGSNRDPATDVALANGILAQCNVRLTHGVNQTATPLETTTWIGADRVAATGTCGAASAEERALMLGATARFGLASRLRAFYVLDIGSHARAESYPPYCATGGAAVIRNMIKVTNTGIGRTLAHETGHILLNSGAHPAGTTNVMSPSNTAPLGEIFTDPQCATVYNNA